ncbi:MAG: UDP-N-acetylmuramate:L-alanyl-gamma-D-glutamyl-meso-diaminopimelate ligase [Deltaproteobacteria bacterium]|nr:UDP-N-acetylmuramate:L-alanyl-gamma-D-glutamyl-meso-diaminopimelate ligase [Deltaproteobacteria bacterium]
MGICGTAMTSLAGILKERGCRVTGSDQNVYPPMSHLLESLGIPVSHGYGARNLHPPPDLVVVGNVITARNPEALELERLRIPYLSLPQALAAFAMEGKRSLVISGTHGKTTTSSAAAWILERAGLDPGFMIGGIPLNFGRNFKMGRGPHFVVEGDEYDTAFFDKGPKFLHYNPWVVILTGIEFDHADIYRDLDQIRENFRKLVRLVPSDGLLIANADDVEVMALAGEAACPIRTYGLKAGAQWSARYETTPHGMTAIHVQQDGRSLQPLATPLFGRHNVSNLLSCVVLGDFLGMEEAQVREAFRQFRGVKRRQEVLGEAGGVMIVDDFAHHPTAVQETIRAFVERFPDRRLVAVFEPRSNSSRRNVFQDRYAQSFDGAHGVMIPEPPMMEKIPPHERFSSSRLVKDLRVRGLEASYFKSTDLLLQALISTVRPGDLVLIMSNGDFQDLPRRLLKALSREAA